jgi:thiopeptide-type bacteriocin biosynthesis protein
LLPFSTLVDWGATLAAPGALGDAHELGIALELDRERLRAELRRQAELPEVREALFLASPSLAGDVDLWCREPGSERGQKIERALVRYFVRLAGRPTPFGLFAGWSTGDFGPTTQLELPPRSRYGRHTRLDMDYLVPLTESLSRLPELAARLRYRPNSSLYRAAGRIHLVESRVDRERARSYHLIGVDDTDYLRATLERASAGAPAGALAGALVAADPEVTPEEAAEYIQELIASQVLVAELAPPVTGPEPLSSLVSELRDLGQSGPAGALAQAGRALEELDRIGLGANVQRYREIAQLVEGLADKPELARLFQVDMTKPAPQLRLGNEVVSELLAGVDLLRRLSPDPTSASLRRFRERFIERYGEREVPLGEVLDEESGIGLPDSDPVGEPSPLLDELALPTADEPNVSWSAQDRHKLRLLDQALRRGAQRIRLAESDLDALAAAGPARLPDAFSVFAVLSARSTDAFAGGDFGVHVKGLSANSGAQLLGRFCHADAKLDARVREHLRAEEALRPDAIFAEVVHLPEGRLGNILLRPVLREHEISYLGRGGADREHQLPLGDLVVAIDQGRIVLRSRRLDREIIPRLSSAHNYTRKSLSIYRFLCELQTTAVPQVGWSWGLLASAPFRPRVEYQRFVLDLARWTLSSVELGRIGHASANERYRLVQELRAELKLPRWVGLEDADNVLPVDLDNALCVETLVQLVRQRRVAGLVELYPGHQELCVAGPEGSFVHELIVTFHRRSPGFAPAISPPSRRGRAPQLERSFAPGSPWLYAKLYAGTASVDRVLSALRAQVIEPATRSGAVERWFFIRYADPHWHLRLRLGGRPERLYGEVLPALTAATAAGRSDGAIERVQLDTYERELERYGGDLGMLLSERIFQADSACVAAVLDLLGGSDAPDARWRLALRGIDALLGDLGFDGAAKRALIVRQRDGFAAELRADAALRRQMGEFFRRERKRLEDLLDPGAGGSSELAPALALFEARSRHIRPIAAELRERAGELTSSLADLAASYVHMHVNRILRADHRRHELVLYDLLARLYDADLARGRSRV